jgi:cell division protein FtsB
MGSDRQDFLERKEARLRRMQQDAAASRSPAKGGKGQSNPASQAQKPAFPRKKSAGANLAGDASRAKPDTPGTTGRGAQKTKLARLPESKPANPSTEWQEESLVGELAGRRSAARRERQASIRPVSNEPKPSMLARVIVWGTIAICGLLVLATLGEVWTVHQLHQQVNASQQAAAQLQNQNRALATQIAQLQQPETIEYEARQLGYIYPGDQPVVVATTQPTPATTPQPSASSAKSGWGFWPDWLKLFFGG